MAGVPYTFQTATTAIPLSQLDTNFQTPITIGSTTANLGQVVTIINNLSLGNVNITSGVISANVSYNIANSTITSTSISYNQGNANAVTTTVTAKLQQTVSVLDFGADSTGTVDSTAAFTAALNYASSIYRHLSSVAYQLYNPLCSLVLVPSGSYKVGLISIPVGVVLQGDGPSTILYHTGGNVGCIQIVNSYSGGQNYSHREGVRNLTIQGVANASWNQTNYTGQTQASLTTFGVYVNQAFGNVVIEGVDAYYCGIGFHSKYHLFGQINNCIAQWCSGDGFFVEYASNVLEIHTCQAYGCGGNGFNITNTSQPNNWNVILKNCDSEYAGLSGIKIVDVKMATIDNCYIELNNIGSRDGNISGAVYDIYISDTTNSGSVHTITNTFVNSIWTGVSSYSGSNISSIYAGNSGSVSLYDSAIVNSGASATCVMVGLNCTYFNCLNSYQGTSNGAVALKVTYTSGTYSYTIAAGTINLQAVGNTNIVRQLTNSATQNLLVQSLSGSQTISQTVLNGSTTLQYLKGDASLHHLGDLYAGGTVDGQGALLQRDGTTGGGVFTTGYSNADAILCGNGTGRAKLLGTPILTPPASATPTNNGEMTFQLTSNTSLVVKVKGSDGVVRSNTLTLS